MPKKIYTHYLDPNGKLLEVKHIEVKMGEPGAHNSWGQSYDANNDMFKALTPLKPVKRS